MTKFVVAFFGALALLVVFGVVGTALESRGVFAKEHAEAVKVASIAFASTLFIVLAFSAVPLAIRLFIRGQLRIGNGNLRAIQFIQEHETSARWAVWLIWITGLLIALPVMIADGFFEGPE